MATHTEFQHLSVAKRNALPVFSIPLFRGYLLALLVRLFNFTTSSA